MDNCPPYGYPLLSHPMEKEPVVITKKLSVWLSLTGSFFYAIMNVPNPSPDFGNRFLFGAILRIDRFVFTQTVFFYAITCNKLAINCNNLQQKIPNRQTNESVFPLARKVAYDRKYSNKKRWAFQDAHPFKII